MPSSSVLLASTCNPVGERRIARSDAGAVHAALSCGLQPVAYCSASDVTAAEYAMAAGISVIRMMASPIERDCELVWIGGGVIEREGDTIAARIAEAQRAAILFDVLECCGEQGRWVVLRDAGRGARDVVFAQGPVVLIMSENAVRPPYVSRYRRQQACSRIAGSRAMHVRAVIPGAIEENSGSRPIGELWQISRPRARIISPASTTPAGAEDRMNSMFGIDPTGSVGEPGSPLTADPETSARHLLRYLIHHGFVQRTVSATESEIIVPPGDSRSKAAQPADTARPILSPRMRRRPRQTGDKADRFSRQPQPFVEITMGGVRTAGGVARRPRPVGQPPRPSRGPFFSNRVLLFISDPGD